MKKRRLKKQVYYILALLFVFLILITIYFVGTGKVNNNKDIIEFTVEEGDTYSTIAESLKEQNLIKSTFFYKLYIKLHKTNSLKVGNYELSSNMNVKKIINTLENKTKNEMITITFKEGINFRDVAQLISKNTDYTEEQVYEITSDSTYLDELIEKYWFLTDDIKEEGIYYPLEGYLFPDTYNFNKNSKIEDIIEYMLDNTDKKLTSIWKDNNKYSIHEIMTMASIVELEASNSDDRAGVAGVFYNRLESGWSLGSDVTTYYGLKLSLNERDLTTQELNEVNDYNTRSSSMAGKLPISPICMPSLESIEAAINPEDHDYYYFVADKNGKTYFNKTSSEHVTTVAKLKKDGLWYEY
jgi:UPF0755 protein